MTSPFFVQYLPLLKKRLSVRLALVSPDPKRHLFESSLISEATPVKVNVSYAASQVQGHRLRWGALRQCLPPCLGLRELQQLKDHPDKACVSGRCVMGLSFLSLHSLYNRPHFSFTTQPNFTVHYSTIDDVVGLLSRFEKGAMVAKVDLKSAFIMVPIQASEWSSHSEAWIGTILNADFEDIILILKPELTYNGGTASYHLGMAFLYSFPQIGTLQSPIQLYTDVDASGTCGYGAYLDGAWFGGNCPHQCLRSWQSSRRSPETPPPQSCGPFNVHHLQGRDQAVLRLPSQI